MAVDVTLLNSNSLSNIQENFERIETALQDVVGRSGDLPNQMTSHLDMNGNDILNINSLDIDVLYIDGEPVVPIDLGGLAANSVGTNQIIDLNVTTGKLADGSVTTIKIADNAVTTAKIVDGSITSDKIVDSAITENKIANLNVTEGKLATALALKINQVQNGWRVVTGLPTDGTTDSVAIIQAAIDAAPDYSVIVVPPGTYAIKSLPIDPSTYWVADGDASIDTPDNAAFGIRNRKGLTIILDGVEFIQDGVLADGYCFYFYKSIDCEIVGGRFVGNATLQAGAGQAAAVLIARCWNVWGRKQSVDSYYRNLFIYRSTNCGFSYYRSTRGGYFCIYLSGLLDISLTAVTDDTFPPVPFVAGKNSAIFGYAQGGKFANFFGDDSYFFANDSVDAGRQGVGAVHFRVDSGACFIINNTIHESSDQNSGDQVDGIQVASASNFVALGGYPTGCIISGNRITGTKVGIAIVGAREVQISDNNISDWYLTGISIVSRVVGADTYVADAINLRGNNISPINSASTVTAGTTAEKKAGIQIQRLNSAQMFVTVRDNGVNVDNRGTIIPTGTWYETYNDAGSTIVRGTVDSNMVRGTGTANIT